MVLGLKCAESGPSRDTVSVFFFLFPLRRETALTVPVLIQKD